MWEQHHRFAAFFQGQLNTIQQGAIAAQAGIPIIFLVLDRACVAAAQPQTWAIVWIGVLAWLLLGLQLFRTFQTDAHRVLATYEAEWDLAFPGIPAQRLASFLLNTTYRQRARKR
ncbi:hypothetical protein GCM10019060_27130 [Novosphingobium pokkalii]|nr:hypothetical protein GCM10019060_27130 [Novosphingobium pokkalii]